ncbi:MULTISPECIES: nitroreductase [Acinetobacter]|uniref:nitroreductase n=1 Tax=Acinetobacter TaxID=469 RepID=UPI000C4B545B|nr:MULTISPECIES: nitroreductase [Acinetobacter]MEC8567339.1 nitroreductase [Pseudomonadota bacterium]MBC67336.1 nitrobenzoate reductase [Acinetobacter sp.]MBT50912.1 nitrobenzoate reductase [Acinetobacter sp.]HIQ33859.1 nitroreductase [Acinetobacter venetianus]HJP48155.1 nitroreductase [Acinetobacter venetianus]
MNTEQVRHVDDAITSRHSVRAFLDTPVDVQTIKDILAVSSRAPSGTNTQPWKVYVVTGQKRAEMIDRVCAAQIELHQKPQLADQYKETFAYYPETWISPFIDRRRENGWGLYGLLNIQKGEKEKMAAQQLRNFQLFDAPVALYFTVNKAMGIGSKMDISMMIQNVMVAAKARGLDTCPQAAWNHFHPIVLDVLNAPDDEELVCTIALGYADPDHIVNTFITPRLPVEDFTVFMD